MNSRSISMGALTEQWSKCPLTIDAQFKNVRDRFRVSLGLYRTSQQHGWQVGSIPFKHIELLVKLSDFAFANFFLHNPDGY